MDQSSGLQRSRLDRIGTFWSDDELIRTGAAKAKAREIGHLPLSGADGLLEQFPKKRQGRKVLDSTSTTLIHPRMKTARASALRVVCRLEIAYDGMEFGV